MRVLVWIAMPFAFVLIAITRGILRLFRQTRMSGEHISEEEIRLLVSESAEQGVIDSDERNMVNRVLRLGDRSVDSMMTPRPRIAWLDASNRSTKTCGDARYAVSRYPVYRGSDKDVLGILTLKRLPEMIGNARIDLLANLAKPCSAGHGTRARSAEESATPKHDSRWSSTNTATSKAWSRSTICFGRRRQERDADATPRNAQSFARRRKLARRRIGQHRRSARTARHDECRIREYTNSIPPRHGRRAFRTHSQIGEHSNGAESASKCSISTAHASTNCCRPRSAKSRWPSTRPAERLWIVCQIVRAKVGRYASLVTVREYFFVSENKCSTASVARGAYDHCVFGNRNTDAKKIFAVFHFAERRKSRLPTSILPNKKVHKIDTRPTDSELGVIHRD